MKQINSVYELKEEAKFNDRGVKAEFCIMLNFGAKSRKGIVYYPTTNTFDVYNYIDDSYEEDLTEEQLRDETHIVIAIERGALYKYDL